MTDLIEFDYLCKSGRRPSPSEHTIRIEVGIVEQDRLQDAFEAVILDLSVALVANDDDNRQRLRWRPRGWIVKGRPFAAARQEGLDSGRD
jgi:hypothetical protein